MGGVGGGTAEEDVEVVEEGCCFDFLVSEEDGLGADFSDSSDDGGSSEAIVAAGFPVVTTLLSGDSYRDGIVGGALSWFSKKGGGV